MADTLTLLAPLSGVMIPLESVPDPAFAQRLVGDGVSIDPVSDRVLAPCDAKVLTVHRAGHALTLSAAGLEIMIHVGIDTVKLAGDGFTARVKTGDAVRAGDELLRFDGDRVARRAHSLLTQMLVTNLEHVASLQPAVGRVAAGRDVALLVQLGGAGQLVATPVPVGGATITSPPIVVTDPTGLHARPASLLAATARRFNADVRMLKEGREANVRSVVSIMALEVGGGDTVTVVARGEDAAAAVQAVTETLRFGVQDAHAAAALAATAMNRVPLGAGGPRAVKAAAAAADGTFVGVSASRGVAIGAVYQLRHDDAVPEERAANPDHERRALEAAISAAHLQLESLQGRLAEEADTDKAAIFGAHQELLEDPEVLDAAAAGIRAGRSAASAWREAYGAQADRLQALRSELLAGRAADLRDVGRRVLHLLVGRDAPHDIPADSIVVAEDLSPSDAASLDRTRVRGFCTTMGSATSHVAILARGLGIPAVAGIDPRVLDLPAGTRVVLDGDAGTLRPAPSDAETAVIVRRQQEESERRARELRAAAEHAVTSDGHRVEVLANIGSLADARGVGAAGGEGVGLLRTEFLFLERRTAPDEDEQAATYEGIARALPAGVPIVIRTLDVGGDKPLSYLPMGIEANPFLGERGIRLTLNRPELFRAQVRAILRASTAGRVAIMFPMVATLPEFRAARALVERERESLGVAPIPIGIMVETAAAALLADRFAREADFFSIGTNDLTQYALAMDRTNPRLAPQVDALHPAVLRLIARTVAGAGEHRRTVAVCGALAGDPQGVPILIGLGVHELSVDVPLVPSVKARVRTLSLADCRVTAEQALAADDGADVRKLVAERHA